MLLILHKHSIDRYFKLFAPFNFMLVIHIIMLCSFYCATTFYTSFCSLRSNTFEEFKGIEGD